MSEGPDHLFTYALRLLGRRDYSRMEMREKLTQRLARRSTAAEIDKRVAALLERLAVEGLQDDDDFAAAYTRLGIMKGWGPIKISHHLRRKGIDEERIGRHCVRAEEFWIARIHELLERRGRANKERDRNYRFLLGRGFSSDQIRRALP